MVLVLQIIAIAAGIVGVAAIVAFLFSGEL